MRAAARIIGQAFWMFLGLYAAALAIFVIGIFGLFGQAREPLSGIFLILLGVPWLQLAGVPDAVDPWFPIIAPVGNIVLLGWMALFFGRIAR